MPTARDMGVDRMGNDKRADLPDRFFTRRRAASQARADRHPAAANETGPSPRPARRQIQVRQAARTVWPGVTCAMRVGSAPDQARHVYAFPRLRTLASPRPEPGPACERAQLAPSRSLRPGMG